MNIYYYVIATVTYYGIQMGGAIIISDVSTIFDFASAIAITALAFIFPGLFYLMAEKKYGQGKNLKKCDHIWAVSFLVIGTVNFLLGIFSAIVGVL